VGRAINRLKEFKILKNVMPVNMLPHADTIIRTCGALCNLQPPLINKLLTVTIMYFCNVLTDGKLSSSGPFCLSQ